MPKTFFKATLKALDEMPSSSVDVVRLKSILREFILKLDEELEAFRTWQSIREDKIDKLR